MMGQLCFGWVELISIDPKDLLAVSVETSKNSTARCLTLLSLLLTARRATLFGELGQFVSSDSKKIKT